MSWKRVTAFFCLFPSMAGVSAWGRQSHATIIYDDRASEIRSVNEEAGRLWITTDDLKRATGFELKPQGICRDELCFPVPKSRQQIGRASCRERVLIQRDVGASTRSQ